MRELTHAILGMNDAMCALDSRVSQRIAPLIAKALLGEEISRAGVLAAIGGVAPERRSVDGSDHIAVISVHGLATYNFEMQPYAYSNVVLRQKVTELAQNKRISAIILDIGSPGGAVTGTPEAADAVFAARKSKKIVALVNPLAASAAYWLASQAHEVIATPSADVGSIGVFMMHVDISGALSAAGIKPTFIFAGPNKVEGNSFEPLAEKTKAHFQSEVNSTYRDFVRAVARGRGLDKSVVESKFGGGRTLMTRSAMSVGMIDAIATPDDAISKLFVGNSLKAEARAERLAALAAPSRSEKLMQARRGLLDALSRDDRAAIEKYGAEVESLRSAPC